MRALPIEIPRRAAQCVQGQECLQPGMEYYSTLVFTAESGEYERRDYCSACWEKLPKASQQSSWKSKVPSKKPGSDLPKQRDARVWHFFREALAQETYEEAFVLALYLARRRHIVLRQELLLENQQPALIYEAPATEEVFCVRKIALSDLRVGVVQRELAQKMQL